MSATSSRPTLLPWKTLVAALGLLVAAQGLTAIHAAARTEALTSCAGNVDTSLRGAKSGNTDVIVVGRLGSSAAAAAVSHAGGRVLAAEPMVNGVHASVPAGRLGQLGCSAAVVSISPNRAVHFQNANYTSDTATASDFVKSSGALSMWRSGNTGSIGLGVAIIDTGVAPMGDFTGRVVYGPDLSGEGTYVDTYGHGTVMAGIIGGDGHDSAGAARGPYTGMAPDTTLVSVKVAGRNGATDVSTVLEAMHWVSAYKSEFNIRVLNLSWGTPSTQSPTVDPLDYAVERLWRQGIVVVAAAGNAGPAHQTILKPADDPLVLTVGAYDDGTSSWPWDDSMPEWSSVGPTAAGYAKPDLVAPGRTLIAQRAYGSQVESENPNALVSPSYIKGSGTSEAAAVTSGAVALLLNARPNLTPDQVKYLLTENAWPMFGISSAEQGSGRLNLRNLIWDYAGPRHQQQPVATGLGSLEQSRGGRHVQVDCDEDGTPDVIVGEITARCQPWTGASWTGASWTGASWTGASWTGASWTGASWTGASWTGASWTGASWTGASWTGASWTGASWTGASWTGASWTSQEWNSRHVPTEFLTAWWGDHPARTLHIPGEPAA